MRDQNLNYNLCTIYVSKRLRIFGYLSLKGSFDEFYLKVKSRKN